MRKTKLWNVRITTTALLTDAVEEILSAQAAAVSVLAPPRQKAVRIDAIFQTKPSARKIGAQLIDPSTYSASEKVKAEEPAAPEASPIVDEDRLYETK